MEVYRRFLDPKLVSQLKGLDLKARLIVEGFLVGLHKSPFHGFSVEFAEHRPYTRGDEIRWIDWKVLARTDRLFVRTFTEETNLKAYILLDASKSMDYPEKGVTKLEYALSLAGALSFLFFLQRDAVGLLVFDEALRLYLPPRTTKTNLHLILKELALTRPQGKTDPTKTFIGLAEKLKKRGLIILLSDLLLEREALLKGLRHFRYRKHEVLVFQILSPEEMELSQHPSLFEDLETRELVPYEPERMRATFKRKMGTFLQEVRRDLLESYIDYELLLTSTPYDRALLSYLKKRERLP